MKTQLTLIALLVSLGCPTVYEPELPTCIQTLIQQKGQEKTGQSFIAIYRYKYQNRYVYFGYADCCDQFNVLFDKDCQLLCSPNGGFTGGGDGKCPNFFKEATDRTEVWRKP